MWISEKIARARASVNNPAQTGRISIGGASAAALLDGERRDLKVVSPGGIYWLPKAGQTALVVECAGGDSAVAGVEAENPPANLIPGELCLTSGAATIYMANNGRINLTGDVYITGRLFIDGEEVQAGGGQNNGSQTQ